MLIKKTCSRRAAILCGHTQSVIFYGSLCYDSLCRKISAVVSKLCRSTIVNNELWSQCAVLRQNLTNADNSLAETVASHMQVSAL